MWLNNDHTCLSNQNIWVTFLNVVIDPQIERVLFVEVADNSDEVSCLNPKLDGPTASQSHLEQNRALYKASQDRLPILIHRRTQLELHDGCEIRLPLEKLDSE